ncbi:MAG: hypothetical protein ACXVY6_04450 [Gaiellaceae bacterium]
MELVLEPVFDVEAGSVGRQRRLFGVEVGDVVRAAEFEADDVVDLKCRWAAWLKAAAREDAGVAVQPVSWQQLIPLLPTRGRSEVLRWAAEKHGLP